MVNVERFNQVLNHLKARPETWDQSSWHCGTSHCFAGHAQIMSGNAPDDETVRKDARMWLDLGLNDANWLFSGNRSIEDFEGFISQDFDENGFNRAGYDRAGYDLDGFNRDGYDLDGFNRDGYDLDGFNRDGYDLAGFNRDGYDRAGFNRDGYDRAGLDKNNQPKSA